MEPIPCPQCGAQHDREIEDDYGPTGDTIIHCACGSSFGVNSEGEAYLLN